MQREQQECMELWVGIGNLTEIIWVGIKEQTNRCDMMLSVCYRLLDLENKWMRPFPDT